MRPPSKVLELQLRGGASLYQNRFTEMVEAQPVYGTIGLVLAYIATEIVGLPSTPMAMALGITHKIPVALAIALSASLFSAMIAFILGRYFLRERSVKKIKSTPRLQAIDTAVRVRGFSTILLLRLLVPLPPAVNYLYGATAAPFFSYLAATAVGNTPGTLLVVAAPRGLSIKLPWYGYAALFFFAALVLYCASRASLAFCNGLDAQHASYQAETTLF